MREIFTARVEPSKASAQGGRHARDESADESFAHLVDGFRRFRAEVYPEQQALFARLAKAQQPRAMFITCADSRIVPELITQSSPGDLFVTRNVGNVVPPYGQMNGGVSSAIEYAVMALDVQHIIVCGHSDCGAMKAVLDPAGLQRMPTVKAWLRHCEVARSLVEQNCSCTAGEALGVLTEENVVAQLDLAVGIVHEDQLGPVLGHVGLMHLGKGRNDQQITHGSTARGRAVDRDHAAAALALDGIGDEALAVVDVPDVHLLVLDDVGGVQQVLVDRAGAFIVQLALCGLDAVDLGFEQGAEHVLSLEGALGRDLDGGGDWQKKPPSLSANRQTHDGRGVALPGAALWQAWLEVSPDPARSHRRCCRAIRGCGWERAAGRPGNRQ